MTSMSPSGSADYSSDPIVFFGGIGETPAKPRKSRSASSELTDLTSDTSGSSRSSGSSTEDAERKTREHDDDPHNTESPYTTDDEETFTERYTGKAPSREERVKYRDLLNTKLEQMFGA